jgi:multiple sugar transport system permease protein
MIVTAMMPTEQLGNRKAPLYPAKIVQIEYQGDEYQLYSVPMGDGIRTMALVKPGRETSLLLDPAHPENGLVEWTGDWHTLSGVYEFHIAWENFTRLFESMPVPQMVGNTLLLILVGEIGLLCSSILVAYGFARFSLPGGNFLFYLLIATILIPSKVTFIPTFYMYIKVLDWYGTVNPMLVHLFFGNAVYIFLLRQNFKSFPIDLEEAAMLDGAGPLRRLIFVILPQSWPVVITVSLLHFFFTWNETRLASLYLGSSSAFRPISFAVQNYQSLIPIQNVIEAATLIVLFVPVLILFFAQKYFLQGLVITGAENKQ